MYCRENTPPSPPFVILVLYYGLSVALYIINFSFKFAFWINGSYLRTTQALLSGEKEGGVLSSKNVFGTKTQELCASQMLQYVQQLKGSECFRCQVTSGFWTFCFGDRSCPASLRHLFIPLPGQRSERKANDAEMLLGDGFWFVLRGGIYPDTKVCANLIIPAVSEVRTYTVCALIFTFQTVIKCQVTKKKNVNLASVSCL